MPNAREGLKGGSPPKLCSTCEAAITSVIDGIGSHDESASVVIVGGGPHALAALSALREGWRQEVAGMDEPPPPELDGTRLLRACIQCAIMPLKPISQTHRLRFVVTSQSV